MPAPTTTRWPVRTRVRALLDARLGHARALARSGPHRSPGRLIHEARRLLPRRRHGIGAASRLMDYGPDWPPSREPPPYPHTLLRRCVAAVILYAVIWALGSALLQVRLFELRTLDGGTVTTYTTVTSPHPH
ncbi:MAG: hypothetical protein ACRDP6_04970 [Actinoallomurus sp.]